ncbi:hypothetical protein VULLAG_LOCUS19165 [Vulpes lagopus]
MDLSSLPSAFLLAPAFLYFQSALSTPWYLRYIASKLRLCLVMDNVSRLLVCLLIHSRIQNEHSFPTEQVL